MENLTPRQQQVLGFIQAYFSAKDTAPSYEEIRDGIGIRSVSTVHKHLKYLERKGYLDTPWGGAKRALKLAVRPGRSVRLPLLGLVAAGAPLEALETPEEIEVPESFLRGGECFALKVRGDSMVEDGIRDGDIVLVKRQARAENGQTVVAEIDGEATVKRFYRRGGLVELRPANQTMQPMTFAAARVGIKGVLIGLMRKYR
jgi:repressor LexA